MTAQARGKTRPSATTATPPAGQAAPAAIPWRWAAVLLALGLLALYAGALGAGFLSDDYVFMEQVRQSRFPASLWAPDPLGNYFRPVSRQIYFGLLQTLIGLHPLGYHLVNFALFLACLVLLADLLAAFAPPWGVLAGVAFFALLHAQRVLLTWVSCAQDLLALLSSLGALALFRRGRTAGATGLYALAAFSKESALPLPALLVLWARWHEGRRWGDAVRRAAGPLAVTGFWLLATWTWHRGHPAAGRWFRAGLSEAAAAYAHMAQSLLFLEEPHRVLDDLLEHPPAWLPLLLLLPLAFWFPARAAAPQAEAARRGLRFGTAWCLLFGVPLIPVVHTWSAYYYTLEAVGAALAAAVLGARLDRWAWPALAAALLWLHAGACGVRAFAVADRPWVWTSHLTPFYFERGAAYVQRLGRQMRELAPSPPHGARLFFATLPSFAGFQTGNGALLRAVYRDSSLRSYFYSQFSESTAGSSPCDFFYWDGERIKRLYPASRGRFTQVAGDLLLLDRPAGARHALLRALGAGEDPREAFYWLGWAEYRLGSRARAEEAWRRMGARDSALAYWRALDRGQQALARGDTAEAHRDFLAAVPFSIGRPEAHRRLGALLYERQPKYALLELTVALQVDPGDRASRGLLAVGLSRLGLHEPARGQVERLWREDPALRMDPQLRAVWSAAHAALSPGADVARFPATENPRAIGGA